MMKKEIVKKVLLIALVILLTLNFTTTEFENVVNENGAENVCLNLLNLKQSAVITGNEQLEAQDWVSGTGTDIDPYIITRDNLHISIRNLKFGNDNIIIRDSCAITVSIDNRNTTIINCTLNYILHFKIIGETIEIFNNSLVPSPIDNHQIVLGSHEQLNLTMEHNNISKIDILIETVSVAGLIKNNHFRSIHWGYANNFLAIYDNVIKNQNPKEFLLSMDNQLNSNFYENYLEFYPDSANNGLYWNTSFTKFDDRPLCKNPLDPYSPPTPNLYFTTTMVKLTWDNWYNYMRDQCRYDNVPSRAYVVNQSDEHFIDLRWECLNTDSTDLYSELYWGTILLVKTQETGYRYHFNCTSKDKEIKFSVVANYEPRENESHKSQARAVNLEVFYSTIESDTNTINASILGIPIAAVICVVWVYLKKNKNGVNK